jgi:peptidyl-tRNA hydrolase
MPAKSTEVASPQTFEILNAAQLAERLNLPTSWIREYCRTSRCSDPIPCLSFGPRYKRFRWNSPELNAWISRRMKGGKQ